VPVESPVSDLIWFSKLLLLVKLKVSQAARTAVRTGSQVLHSRWGRYQAGETVASRSEYISKALHPTKTESGGGAHSAMETDLQAGSRPGRI